MSTNEEIIESLKATYEAELKHHTDLPYGWISLVIDDVADKIRADERAKLVEKGKISAPFITQEIKKEERNRIREMIENTKDHLVTVSDLKTAAYERGVKAGFVLVLKLLSQLDKEVKE